MLAIVRSNRFLKDLRLAKKRGFDLSLLEEVVNKLANQETLDPKYRDHPLTGEYRDFRECHIKPDWLLIYYVEGDVLTLTATGSHADLFDM